MKTFIPFMFLMLAFLFTLSPGNQVQAANPTGEVSFSVDYQNTALAAFAQEEGGVPVAPEQTQVGQETAGNFFSDNWGALILGLLGFLETIARLTPTE